MGKTAMLMGCLCLAVAWGQAGDASPYIQTVCGVSNAVPKGYVPPLVSNGSLCMLVDQSGGQIQQPYVNMVPGIYWAGRRYDPPGSRLIPFGHFEWRLAADGTDCAAPATWSQTLDTRSALVLCSNTYGSGVTVETSVFTPLGRDLVVLKRRFVSSVPGSRKIRSTFRYFFTEPRREKDFPRRVTGSGAWDGAARCARIRYQADGYPGSSGLVSVFSDRDVSGTIEGQRVELTSELSLDGGKTAEQTVYLLFVDTLDGKDVDAREGRQREAALREGCAGLLAEHTKRWSAYWDAFNVRVPDAAIQRMYTTAQYHLLANATKWSFPVGIFNTHWAGRYFGWDEMFCYQALVSSNHPEIAQRCPEFRFAGLKKALYRKAHYGKPGIFGAQYPWEALEDGAEGAPPYGFWADHVFHMSNIALAAWYQYLYTDDLAYLQKTGYPVIKECARFFLANMVYELPDGSMIIGKCTDLERLGTARQNPFMTSCGAIYTLESAARSATLLACDEAEAATWRAAAAKLRESLPRENDRYVPYKGCQEESVASLGGLFPYPLFDERETLQKNAVYNYVKNGRAYGNMYQMGSSVCAWYLGWMAAALAELGDRAEPARMLQEAASGAGCFGEMFEINEEHVSRTPWFSTASGNVVFALNQMLVQSREDRIYVARGVPDAWKDVAFRLACHGGIVADVEVKGGKLVRLTLISGEPSRELHRTLVLPQALAAGLAINPAAVKRDSLEGNERLIDVSFKDRLELVGM